MENNKIITLITGANRGMGLALANKLAQAGQKVIIGSRNLDNGKRVAQEIIDAGFDADTVQLDVTNSKSVAKAAQQITKKYGYLTTLINNAGSVFDFGIEPSEVSQALIRKDFEVNYFGLIDVTQKMFPLLTKAPQAKIINISSMMGSKTEALNPNSGVYPAVAVGYQSAKAAANMYTVQLAKEMSRLKLHITVNAIDPGMVATEFGGVDPEFAKSLGAIPVEKGISRTIALATDFNIEDNATFTNTNGPVAW